MGRRALPKIDRSIDYTGHHTDLDALPCPFEGRPLFGRDAPLEVEIGSGKGLFLLNASGADPHTNFLGIEAAKKYARFAAFRLAKHGRHNAHVISGDAIPFLADYLPNQSARAVHVYFPDPWWKERHRRRRIMQPSVIEDIHRVLLPDGELHFWTDVEEYFELTLQLIARLGRFSGPWDVPVKQPENDMDYQTHFERRMRLKNHPVFRARFVKP